MKKSFSILEIIIIIFVILLLYSTFIPKTNHNFKLDEITNRLILYIAYTRFKALVDEKFNDKDEKWHKKRWSIKFLRCRNDNGLYYSIYSDENESGQISKEDTLKDPLTNKHIYSSNSCEENNSNSKYVLLTKNFDVTNVEVSCNKTDSLGQLAFSSDGKVYARLSANPNESDKYEIKEPCFIKLISRDKQKKEIKIVEKTGFVLKN